MIQVNPIRDFTMPHLILRFRFLAGEYEGEKPGIESEADEDRHSVALECANLVKELD